MTKHRWLLPAFRAGRQAPDRQGDQRPGAAPQGHADRRDRLQAHHAHRRVVPDAHEAQRRADHRPRSTRSRRPASGPRTAPSVPADVLVLATGFATHGFVAPMEIAGAGGRTLTEAWAERAARVPRPERARLPEHVPALRAEHQRRRRLGDLHDRGGHQPRDRRARRAGARRRAHASRSPARPPSASTASCATRWPARSGTRAAPTGTWTRTATTRTSGRGCGAPTAAARSSSSRARTSWSRRSASANWPV